MKKHTNCTGITIFKILKIIVKVECDEQSGTVSPKNHSVITLIRLKSKLLSRFQSIILKFLNLNQNQNTSLAKTTSGALVESIQLALSEIRNFPPFLR